MQHILNAILEIHPDRTGFAFQVPGLIDGDGNVMMPLARYLQYLFGLNKSQAHLSKIREAVRLFAEYSITNNPGCDFGRGTTGSVQKVKHWEHFQNFRSAVVFGTFGTDGLDPSGLCWQAKGSFKADQTIDILTKFFSWLDNLDGGNRAARFNPVVEGEAYEHLLAAAAYEHSRSRALLGHTWASAQEKEVEVRALQGASPRKQPTSEPKRISRIQLERLLTYGFDINSENGLRDALIAILMNKGGLRLSEALHVWVIDINDDPASPRSALVRVLHPSQAKSDLQHRRRTFKNRSDYLRAVYGLKDRSSLVKRDALHLGWKSRFTVLEVYWAEPWWGKVFLGMWRRYLRMTAARRQTHPYAWIDSVGDQPLTSDAYAAAYERAVYRAGLVPPGEQRLKPLGLTSHGNRHAYGHRLKNEYGLDAMLVKKALNHTSIDSQLCYTVRSRAEVMTEIERARQRRREQELQEMKAGIQGVREVLCETSGSASEDPSAATGVPHSILLIVESEFQ